MRVHRSITVVRYSQPSSIRRYVMSPTSFAPGASEVKPRLMRSSKTLPGSEGIVVRLNARIRFATHPFSAMIAATVPTDTFTPAAASFVWTRRWLKIHIAIPVVIAIRAAGGLGSFVLRPKVARTDSPSSIGRDRVTTRIIRMNSYTSCSRRRIFSKRRPRELERAKRPQERPVDVRSMA